jgi:hypothetical protein
METRSTFSGYYSGLSVLSLGAGVGFLCVCLVLWWFTRQPALILFGVAMFFGGMANGLACVLLHRMDVAGYDVGYRRSKDLRLYCEYWRIAPRKGWSRWTLGGAILCFLLAALFLFSTPTIAGHPPVR